MTKAQWDALHENSRVPINDNNDVSGEQDYGLFSVADAWTNGNINKAVYETALLNGIDVTGYNGKWVISTLATKIKKFMLYGKNGTSQGDTPIDTLSFRGYPTSTILLSTSASDWKENPDWNSNTNPGVDPGGDPNYYKNFRYMFKLKISGALNFKLPYDLDVPYFLNDLEVGAVTTPYTDDDYLQFLAGVNVKAKERYVYCTNSPDGEEIKAKVEVKHLADGISMSTPQYLDDNGTIRIVTDTASWPLVFTGMSANQDPATIIEEQDYYYSTSGFDCNDMIWQNTKLYYRANLDKYYTDSIATLEVGDVCYTDDNTTAANRTFFHFNNGVLVDTIERDCIGVLNKCTGI